MEYFGFLGGIFFLGGGEEVGGERRKEIYSFFLRYK